MDVITVRNELRASSMINRTADCLRMLCVLLVAALMALQAAGQSIVTGDAVGTVTDPSGAVIPGATVTLTNLGTNAVQTTSTESSGFFRFSLLNPGSYKLAIRQTGFKSVSQKIEVSVGQITTTNARLDLGATSEVLEVTGAAPLIETENANLATPIPSTNCSNCLPPAATLLRMPTRRLASR